MASQELLTGHPVSISLLTTFQRGYVHLTKGRGRPCEEGGRLLLL